MRAKSAPSQIALCIDNLYRGSMGENISKFQEIQLLLLLIKHADEKGNIDFDETDIDSDIDKIVWNRNFTDRLLYKLSESGVIHYEENGEDGFKPFVYASISVHTHEYLASLIQSAKEEHEILEARIAEILTFNPELLSKTISETQSKLDDVYKHINGNELLKPIEKPLEVIRHHFESVNRVYSNYEDIYKNIIRPVQEEGRSGVKATVKWAIISIILSTCISFIISNLDQISVLFASV